MKRPFIRTGRECNFVDMEKAFDRILKVRDRHTLGSKKQEHWGRTRGRTNQLKVYMMIPQTTDV